MIYWYDGVMEGVRYLEVTLLYIGAAAYGRICAVLSLEGHQVSYMYSKSFCFRLRQTLKVHHGLTARIWIKVCLHDDMPQ